MGRQEELRILIVALIEKLSKLYQFDKQQLLAFNPADDVNSHIIDGYLGKQARILGLQDDIEKYVKELRGLNKLGQ